MPARPPSLRAIAAFEATARHSSLTRAAAELNLTTSAISHAITALEARLQTPLLDRSRRRVSLTPAGQTLAIRVRLSLALLGEAFDATPWLERGRLVLSTLDSIAERVLVPALPDFARAFPDVALELRTGSALADVERDADVAIRFGPGGWRGLQSRHLSDERLFPVASPAYRGGRLPRDPAELRACNLIGQSESTWRLWLDPLGLDLADFGSMLSIDQASLALAAAANGSGVALARERLAREDLRSGRLVRLFDHEVSAEYAYWAVWSGGTPRRDLILRFVEWAATLFSSDPEPPLR